MQWSELKKPYGKLSDEDKKTVDSLRNEKREEIKICNKEYKTETGENIPIIEGFFNLSTIVYKCPNCGGFHKIVEDHHDIVARIYGSNKNLVDLITSCDGVKTLMRIQLKTRDIFYWEIYDY